MKSTGKKSNRIVLAACTALLLISGILYTDYKYVSCIKKTVFCKDENIFDDISLCADFSDEKYVEYENYAEHYKKDDGNKRHLIENVPHIYQKEKYPTGCESVAAVSLMNYCGIDISADEFIEKYLPKSCVPFCDDDGIVYGESPYEYFIGDPYSSNGYGCYAPVILDAMKNVLAESRDYENMYPKLLKDMSLRDIAEKYISDGTPVIVWATIRMQKAYAGDSWTLPNGERFTFICPEHALVLTGYDEYYYYFSDPMSEEPLTVYKRYDCESAFKEMGMQAIVIEK